MRLDQTGLVAALKTAAQSRASRAHCLRPKTVFALHRRPGPPNLANRLMMNKAQEHDNRLEEIEGTLPQIKSKLAELEERVAKLERPSRSSENAAKGFGSIGVKMVASKSKR
jgi:hypothetical protein